jgi:hypothetical protein
MGFIDLQTSHQLPTKLPGKLSGKCAWEIVTMFVIIGIGVNFPTSRYISFVLTTIRIHTNSVRLRDLDLAVACVLDLPD